jgi:hypothetical protein
MLLNILQNNLILILILVTFSSMIGVFVSQNYYKKIACLASCFSSIILLFFVISFNSTQNTQILSILVSVIIIFSATIATGIAIIDKVNR